MQRTERVTFRNVPNNFLEYFLPFAKNACNQFIKKSKAHEFSLPQFELLEIRGPTYFQDGQEAAIEIFLKYRSSPSFDQLKAIHGKETDERIYRVFTLIYKIAPSTITLVMQFLPGEFYVREEYFQIMINIIQEGLFVVNKKFNLSQQIIAGRLGENVFNMHKGPVQLLLESLTGPQKHVGPYPQLRREY